MPNLKWVESRPEPEYMKEREEGGYTDKRPKGELGFSSISVTYDKINK